MRSSRFLNEELEGKGSGSTRNATNREILVDWQEKRLRLENQMYNVDPIPRYYCLPRHGIGSHCRVALYPENEADINCLVVFKNVRLHEKYFIGRTITHSLHKFSLISIIVENWGGTQALRLYIMPRETDPLFIPAGMVVIITQPKVREMYNGNYILWCTDSLDIHFIDELGSKRLFPKSAWKGIIPSEFERLRHQPTTTRLSYLMYDLEKRKDKSYELVEQIIHQGNELFLMKKYAYALAFYHRAHKIAGNDTDILVNRSIARLKVGYFSLAYADANHALKFKPLFVQAVVRKLRALTAMNKYHEGIDFLKTYAKDLEDFEHNDTAIATLSMEELRLRKMLKEHESGVYNMHDLITNDNGKIEDCGEHLGPLQIKNIPGKGRGVIATKDIKEGEVVLATRAYEIIYIDPDSDDEMCETEMQRKEFSVNSVEQLLSAIMKHLAAEPHTKKDIMSLYAGPQMNHLNRDDVKMEMEINVYRIRKIIDYNAFSFRYFSGSRETKDCHKGIGLWVQPSYINHSCMDCNCFWKVYGDFLFVRAFKDISAGEEILIPYFNPTKNYLSRKIDLENVGINCDCRLCRIEKTISKANLQKKLEIMERCNRQKTFVEPNLQTHQLIIRRDLEALKRMYKNRKYNLDLINMRRESSCYYIKQGSMKKATEELKLAHSLCTGTCLSEIAVTYAINVMWLLLQNEQDRGNAKKWADVLKRDLILTYGSVDVMKHIPEFAVTLDTMEHCGVQFR